MPILGFILRTRSSRPIWRTQFEDPSLVPISRILSEGPNLRAHLQDPISGANFGGQSQGPHLKVPISELVMRTPSQGATPYPQNAISKTYSQDTVPGASSEPISRIPSEGSQSLGPHLKVPILGPMFGTQSSRPICRTLSQEPILCLNLKINSHFTKFSDQKHE